MFVFPQSAPHVNGNGSLKDFPTSSKASTSSSAAGKPGNGPASSSISHSISRPTTIPDQDKRQKLSFFIGQGKQNRPASSSSYSQPSSASSSSSSSQSTSDAHSVPHVNGTSCSNGDHAAGNGTSFLVPYSQESSEESDQESGGALDNGGLSKSQTKENNVPADVCAGSPQNTNGEPEVHQNGHKLNGPTCGDSKSTPNGHEHHKVTRHSTPEKVFLLSMFTACT